MGKQCEVYRSILNEFANLPPIKLLTDICYLCRDCQDYAHMFNNSEEIWQQTRQLSSVAGIILSNLIVSGCSYKSYIELLDRHLQRFEYLLPSGQTLKRVRLLYTELKSIQKTMDIHYPFRDTEMLTIDKLVKSECMPWEVESFPSEVVEALRTANV
jgi:hypothetical protein